MAPLRKILGRLAAIGLLAVMAAGIWLAVVQPIAGRLEDVRVQIDTARQLLGRYKDAERDQVTARQRAVQLDALKRQTLFVEGESDAVKAAAMQADVMRLAVAQNIRLDSTRMLPALAIADIRLIGVEVQMTASLAQLKKLIETVEAARPVLFVRRLHVALAAPMASGDARLLRIVLSVFGATSQVTAGEVKDAQVSRP